MYLWLLGVKMSTRRNRRFASKYSIAFDQSVLKIILFYVNVCLHVSMCTRYAQCPQRPEKGAMSLELELHMIVSYHTVG